MKTGHEEEMAWLEAEELPQPVAYTTFALTHVMATVYDGERHVLVHNLTELRDAIHEYANDKGCRLRDVQLSLAKS